MNNIQTTTPAMFISIRRVFKALEKIIFFNRKSTKFYKTIVSELNLDLTMMVMKRNNFHLKSSEADRKPRW